MRAEKKIRKYGYEYTLVECDRGVYEGPRAFGLTGYALKSVRKLTKKERDGEE
jgi:hypothetical protein